MSEPFYGEVKMFGCNFAPQGWALCNGQVLQIQQNTGLFSLLGTFYGGDGRTTFGLPDFQGRCAIGVGQGPGLTNHEVGEVGGEASHSLTVPELPAHSHPITATSDSATSAQPGGGRLAKAVSAGFAYGTGGSPVEMSTAAVAPSTGFGAPHSNLQPYLTLTFCIALQGIFPQRP